MVWVLLVVTGVLAVLVGVLARRVHRLEQRLERRLEAGLLPSSGPDDRDLGPVEMRIGSLDANEPAPTEYVITRVGELVEEPVEPVPTVPAPVFADLVLKETVVQTASLFHGLRRALAPETRNRIRFHMRQEVKRSRKQRRADLKVARREWAARQRAAMAADEPARGSAA
jgi:hypothetical protein